MKWIANWAAMSKALASVSLKAPIIDGEMDDVSYTRWFKCAFNMEHTADENAEFEDAIYNRDCARVDWLDYDTDLSRDAEWERVR
jgi:hypothetical protein